MKQMSTWMIIIGMIVLMMACIAVSASASHYEPDGTTEEIYCYDASECNRKRVVNCVDESGTLIKKECITPNEGKKDLRVSSFMDMI